MAKVIRLWGPPLAAAIPALYVTLTGALTLIARMSPTSAAGAAAEPATASAVGLVACGMGLLAAASGRTALRSWRYGAAAIALLIGAGGSLQMAIGPSLFPGTSLPAAVSLILCSILLAAYDGPRNRVQALLVQLLIGALLAITIVSIIAQDVNAEGLLAWYRWSRMQPSTAGAFLAAAVAFLALAGRSTWYFSVYAGREDEKILVLALGILSLLAVGMGVAAFAALERSLERSVRITLSQTVSDRAAFLDNLLANRITRASIIARRPSLVATLRKPGAGARAALHDDALSYLASGFNGLAIRDARGQVLAQAGALAPADAFGVDIASDRAQASLLWNGAFVLRVVMPVLDGAVQVGSVVSEQELELLARLQSDVGLIGRTAEWVLCAPLDARMACFPRRFAPWPEVLPQDRDGEPVPMHFALLGRSGMAIGPDYRGDRVIAAYSPVGSAKLGVVLKMAVDEFYAPLRNDLNVWWRWYFAFVLAGALLVASQVRPVAQRLVRSEKMARDRAEVLARSERALRDLYSALGDGILVLTPEGTIEFANPAAGRIFGYEPQALVGLNVSGLIPEELRAANRKATQRFVEQGTSNVIDAGTLVFPALRRDGARFDVEFSLARMRLGDEPRLVAVVRDVSERTALERMKSEFTAAVSHELRTPLTSVMGSLELLREEAELTGMQRDFVDMAWRNSERLAALVNDVLDAERIESGGLRFESTRFPLRAVLEEAVQLNQGYGASHGVAIVLEHPVPEAAIEADRGRLLQVLANLLSNAAKFSASGGEVLLRAERRGERVRVEVCDRGSGIPEDFRPRVFEKFAQADASDARSKGGTGLGLSICKAIVQRMGGTIGFEDRAGGGTTFWFELPSAA